MVRLFLLDQYDDAELDRKKTAAMFAGFITKTAPEEPMMGEAEENPDGAAMASLEPGTLQVLLPGEDVKFSSPADGRCCKTIPVKDSHHESMRLHGLDEQAISRPLSHDELVRLQRVTAEARFAADLGRQGHDLARAA
jgi:hypothetical protein